MYCQEVYNDCINKIRRAKTLQEIEKIAKNCDMFLLKRIESKELSSNHYMNMMRLLRNEVSNACLRIIGI